MSDPFISELNAGIRRIRKRAEKLNRLRPAPRQVKQVILPDTGQVCEAIAISGDEVKEVEFDEDRTITTTTSDKVYSRYAKVIQAILRYVLASRIFSLELFDNWRETSFGRDCKAYFRIRARWNSLSGSAVALEKTALARLKLRFSYVEIEKCTDWIRDNGDPIDGASCLYPISWLDSHRDRIEVVLERIRIEEIRRALIRIFNFKPDLFRGLDFSDRRARSIPLESAVSEVQAFAETAA